MQFDVSIQMLYRYDIYDCFLGIEWPDWGNMPMSLVILMNLLVRSRFPCMVSQKLIGWIGVTDNLQVYPIVARLEYEYDSVWKNM